MIELDLDIANVGRRRAPDQQPDERGIGDVRRQGRHEIVGRLGLKFACARRAREGGDLAVRAARAEEEWGSGQLEAGLQLLTADGQAA